MKKNNFIFYLDGEQYQITGIKILTITINNKFHYNHLIEAKNPSLVPKKGHVTLEAIILEEGGSAYQALKKAALESLPLKGQILSDEGLDLSGTFFLSNFELDQTTGDLPEISFTMISSGSYSL
jgi:hypothetical protein